MTANDSAAGKRKRWIRLTIPGVAGGVGGFFGARFVFMFEEQLNGIDLIGLLVAVILFGSGLFVLVKSASARVYTRLEPNDGQSESPDRTMLIFARRQGIVSMLAGVLFAAPPLAIAFGLPEALRLPLFGAIVALIAVESWANWRIWRDGDELVRSVVTRSGAICFWLLQGLFFLWAAAERLLLVAPVSSWTLLIVLMGVYLVVGSWVSVRSGLTSH